MTEKAALEYIDGGAQLVSPEKDGHGDKALAVIGDERVVVTAEEVCSSQCIRG